MGAILKLNLNYGAVNLLNLKDSSKKKSSHCSRYSKNFLLKYSYMCRNMIHERIRDNLVKFYRVWNYTLWH